MAAAAAGNRILLSYKRSKLVSWVTGKLAGLVAGLRVLALFSMAQSCGAARISTKTTTVRVLLLFENINIWRLIHTALDFKLKIIIKEDKGLWKDFVFQ